MSKHFEKCGWAFHAAHDDILVLLNKNKYLIERWLLNLIQSGRASKIKILRLVGNIYMRKNDFISLSEDQNIELIIEGDKNQYLILSRMLNAKRIPILRKASDSTQPILDF